MGSQWICRVSLASCLCLGIGEAPALAGDYFPPRVAQWPTDGPTIRVRAVEIQGPTAYLADGQLHVVDVSDSSRPRLLQSYTLVTGRANDVKVVGDLAYLAAGRWGMEIVSVAHPEAVRLVGRYEESFPDVGSRSAIAVTGERALLAGGSGGLSIFDVSDPKAPRLLGRYSASGGCSGVVAVGDYAILDVGEQGLHSNSALEIVDLSDPTQPRWAGVFYGDWSPRSVLVSFAVHNGVLFYPGREGLSLFDLSELPRLRRIGRWAPESPTTCQGVAVTGPLAYVVGDRGLKVLDVNDLTQPRLVGEYTPRANVSDVAVAGSTAYLASEFTALELVDLGDATAPRLLSALQKGRVTAGVAEGPDRTLVVANGYAGVDFLDFEDPEQPRWLGGCNTGTRPASVCVDGAYAYVTDYRYGYGAAPQESHGLEILDIRDVRQPRRIASVLAGQYVRGVAVRDSLAYATSNRGFDVLDVSDPANPTPVATVTNVPDLKELRLQENFAFATAPTGMWAIDITVPREPRLVTHYGTTLRTEGGLAVDGKVGFLGSYDQGLVVVDLVTPARPVAIGMYSTDSPVVDVAAAGGWAVVATRGTWNSQQSAYINQNLTLLDVRDPRHPRGTGSVPVGADRLTLRGDQLLASLGRAGLQVYEFRRSIQVRRDPEARILLEWTPIALGMTLEQSPTLGIPSWTPFPDSERTNQVILPATNAAGYFRLTGP